MMERIRVVLLLTRPGLLVVFGLFAATGLAQVGASEDLVLLVPVLVVVVAFMLSCVALNDLADRAIDEVNLAGDRSRPLVTAGATEREFLAIAAIAGVVAIVVGAFLSPLVAVTVTAGLVFSVSYSLRPVRIAERGALASLLLPFGYVAVPYLTGTLSVRNGLTAADLSLGAALYVGFIGRILLKDFRDLRGDSLFGKRTFLVRHGRRWTCFFSGVFWAAGTGMLAGQPGVSWPVLAAYAAYCAVAVGLLAALSHDRGPRRDERLIAATALIGRGTVLTALAQLSLADQGSSAVTGAVVILGLAIVTLGSARTMALAGPTTRAGVSLVPGGRLVSTRAPATPLAAIDAPDARTGGCARVKVDDFGSDVEFRGGLDRVGVHRDGRS